MLSIELPLEGKKDKFRSLELEKENISHCIITINTKFGDKAFRVSETEPK